MALSTLVATLRLTLSYQASGAATGSILLGTSTNQSPTKSVSFGTAAPNATAGGADEIIVGVASISASSSTTLDLTAIADVLGTTVALARVKMAVFWLLSTTDDSSVGTAASSVTIGNAATNVQALFFDADADTATILNGEFLAWGSPAAAGKTVDSTNKSVKLLNNDGAVTAKLLYAFAGGTS